MIASFLRDGTQGSLTVTVEQVDDPAAIGKPPSTRGFPNCTAVVDHPGQGCRALFGAEGRITLRPVQPLAPGDWDAHLPFLGTSCPGWVFDEWQPEP
ncbi:hypothetical protein [Streptomyces sp. NPDC006274]|uniref:hypothetical protein n=1 Tax=unclassified Streptomyces TaxID=2593676 RepID=UPI0033B56735